MKSKAADGQKRWHSTRVDGVSSVFGFRAPINQFQMPCQGKQRKGKKYKITLRN